MIAKLLTSLSTSMEDSSFFLYTSTVKAEDLLEAETLRYSPMVFQEELARGLNALMVKLGLGFGAIDLIKTPEGEYVFLGVNPTGEWGMLERDLHYSISGAIADTLLS